MSGITIPGSQAGGEGITIDFDVWVDGQYSSRTVIGGVPDSGPLGSVYVTLAMAIIGTDLVVVAGLTPLNPSEHVVGIGWNNYNGGVVIAGPLGETLDVTFTWLNAFPSGILASSGCVLEFRATIGQASSSLSPKVSGLLYSHGRDFDRSDEIFVFGTSSTDLYGKSVEVLFNECGEYRIDVRIPSEIQAAEIYFTLDHWHVRVDDAPTLIRVEREALWNWDGGYRVSFDSAVAGTLTGVVYKFGQAWPITSSFFGLRSANILWDDTSPWVSLGFGLPLAGNWIRVAVADLGLTATKLQNGYTYFDNDWAIDNALLMGQCASAFYGAASECAEWT